MVNIITALGLLAELEDAMSDLYVWLSDAYDDEPEVSGRFFQLGMQETRHSAMIRYHRRLAMRSEQACASVDLDERELARLLAAIASLRTARSRPSLDAILELTIAVEVSAAERIHHVLARDRMSGISELGSALARDDERHSAMLVQLARRVAEGSSAADSSRILEIFCREANGLAVLATV